MVTLSQEYPGQFKHRSSGQWKCIAVHDEYYVEHIMNSRGNIC